MSNEAKNDMNLLLTETKKFIFNELYVKFYNDYGKDVGRGPIKQKLKELITDDDVKEAMSSVVDEVEIPPTILKKIKAFFVHSSNTAPTSPC